MTVALWCILIAALLVVGEMLDRTGVARMVGDAILKHGGSSQARLLVLVMISAGIIFLLGALHLLYTFRGPKLQPRQPELKAAMNEVSPGISDQTTMWRAWVGFNASHSMGAMLFGLVYAYMAMFAAELLFDSIFLIAVGSAMLIGLLLLARQYWFRIPFAGIVIALICFVAGVVLS